MLQPCSVFSDLRMSLASCERRLRASKVVASAVSARCWQGGGANGGKSAASTAKQAVWIHNTSHVDRHARSRHAVVLVIPCMQRWWCGGRRTFRQVKLCSKGAGTSTSKRRCSSALQRALAQDQQLMLALQCMPIGHNMCRRTLAQRRQPKFNHFTTALQAKHATL